MLPGLAACVMGDLPAVVELLSDTTSVNATLTSTNHPIGAASADREVFVLITGMSGVASGRTLTGVTIGGITADIHVNAAVSSGGSQIAAIASANVPTGTTATIVLTFSGGMEGVAMSVICLTKLSSRTPYHTNKSEQSASGTSTSTTIDKPRDGYTMAVFGASDGNTSTWSGLSETMDVDAGAGQHSVATQQPTTTAAAQAVSSTHSSTGRRALAVLSMR